MKNEGKRREEMGGREGGKVEIKVGVTKIKME